MSCASGVPCTVRWGAGGSTHDTPVSRVGGNTSKHRRCGTDMVPCQQASFVSTHPLCPLVQTRDSPQLRDLAGASTQLLRATAQNQEPPPTRARATSTVRPTAGRSIAAQSPLNRRSTPLNAAQSAALPAAQSPAAHPPVPSPPSIRRRRLNQYPRLVIPSARLAIDWLDW